MSHDQRINVLLIGVISCYDHTCIVSYRTFEARVRGETASHAHTFRVARKIA